ncbi:pro-sigmaK processing inhibitor BofA family protein [Lysinibacillus pakistanensis]|uniref:Pro-sigmaK processing inhibitor BofA family protein n=1 Tax=Lysinibacillus pakistanensis TaxID=759811 RepID=A0AAX3WZ69_9BACI|nr:pro-sigmaK processing inhibitor BofA family protein [Lysinibacillus pakistanensis]MDM5231158.1 pro-sigmaK processing inhibitor BofA family protein [Lysinibacillus pakistanensis]WHY46714.1 pro-sigmaK processing inhibitor BofA family protein [Lysinibacillus pakistanensis]WHY51727.1 pro-sigmaK processing inhibitor BofA family protein [Lysinibacillus pakistanensis]
MSWLVIMSIGVPVVLLFLYVIIRHAKMGRILEGMSVFWFRFAFAFLLLFVIHMSLGYVGYNIPINLFSVLTIAILGIPGVFGITALIFFL